MFSSSGFRSVTLLKYLFNDFRNQNKLMADFQRYDQQTNSLQFVEDKDKNTVIKFRPNYPENQGIEWLILDDIYSPSSYNKCPVAEIKIYPKLFIGGHDAAAISTYEDMNDSIIQFNDISKKISKLLGNFEICKMRYINYSCNLDVNELLPGCTVEQIADLVKRTSMLPIYDKYTDLDDTSPLARKSPHVHYVWRPVLNVYCDRKNMEILKGERDVINFEFPCHYFCACNVFERTTLGLNTKFNLYEDLLSHDTCNDVIDYYLTVILGKGSWYSLREAIAKIRQYRFPYEKENQLIEALEFVHDCWRNVVRVTVKCRDDAKFTRTLKELDEMGINPVTLPDEWGIDRIQNLLEAYHEQRSSMST